MEEKRKASGDPPETSRPPARMRSASADDEDVSHGGGSRSGGERERVEVVPPPQPLPDDERRACLIGCAVLSKATEMTEKRKASGDPSEASRPPARMRNASTDDEDVSHGGGSGRGGERERAEVVPQPQPLPMAGMDANLTDNSGRIDSSARDEGQRKMAQSTRLSRPSIALELLKMAADAMNKLGATARKKAAPTTPDGGGSSLRSGGRLSDSSTEVAAEVAPPRPQIQNHRVTGQDQRKARATTSALTAVHTTAGVGGPCAAASAMVDEDEEAAQDLAAAESASPTKRARLHGRDTRPSLHRPVPNCWDCGLQARRLVPGRTLHLCSCAQCMNGGSLGCPACRGSLSLSKKLGTEEEESDEKKIFRTLLSISPAWWGAEQHKLSISSIQLPHRRSLLRAMRRCRCSAPADWRFKCCDTLLCCACLETGYVQHSQQGGCGQSAGIEALKGAEILWDETTPGFVSWKYTELDLMDRQSFRIAKFAMVYYTSFADVCALKARPRHTTALYLGSSDGKWHRLCDMIV